MKLAQALEQLAQMTRFDAAAQTLIQQQSIILRESIKANDATLLQRHLSPDECLAHETLVVQ